MHYFIFALIGLVSTGIILFFGARKGVVDTSDKMKIYKPCDDKVVPYKGTKLILITIFCFVISVTLQISLYFNTEVVSFIKLYGLFVIVACAGIVDSKRKIIPNVLILAGLIFRAAIYVYELFTIEDLKTLFTNDLIGLAIGFGFLSVVSLVTKGALGFGDVKLFGVIGITSGFFCTYSTLVLSLLLSVAFSIVGLVSKKLKRKDAFPFGPCIMFGYILVVYLTSY